MVRFFPFDEGSITCQMNMDDPLILLFVSEMKPGREK